MAITKTANEYFAKGDEALYGVGRGLFATAKNVLKRVSVPAWKTFKGVGIGSVKALGAAGRTIGKHPKAGLPMLGAAALTAYSLPKKVRTGLTHVDPDNNLTRQGLLRIKNRPGAPLRQNLYY